MGRILPVRAAACACIAAMTLGCAGREHGAQPESMAPCTEPLTGSLRVVHELRTAEAGIDQPEAIQADGQGGLWVLDPTAKVVAHFDSTGALLATITKTGPAPWELSTPQAIGADSAAGVWVADAVRARVARFSANGTFIEAVSTPAAISAAAVARDEHRLYLSQNVLGGGGVARGFVRTASLGDTGAPGLVIDSLSPDRLASAPFHGAPMIESIVAVRPGGGTVVTYPVSYRLRFFDGDGQLEREVPGCDGGDANAKQLKGSSMERGMSFRPMISVMQYDTSGTLTVAVTTPEQGTHRIDAYDQDGNRLRSMRLPTRSAGGVYITGLVPGPTARTHWALDRVVSHIRLIEVTWPTPP